MTGANEILCGLGGWRPECLQKLASKKVYMFIYGSLGIIQGMFFSYLSATLATIERQFGIKSKEAAYLMSGNEFSQILFVFVMPMLVKVKKRPLWTALGLWCSAIGCFLMAVPHWSKSPQQVITNHAMEDMQVTSTPTEPLCNAITDDLGLCDAEGNRVVDWEGLIIMFSGILLTGIGNCVFYSFGIAYLDDNTSHENSPFMLSLSYTARLLGPTAGYLLGSFCLKTYVYPSQVVEMQEGDPNWVGAWWLGFPIIGALIFVFACPLMLFPERLPKDNTDSAKRKAMEDEMTNMLNNPEKNEKIRPSTKSQPKDKAQFKDALKRLLTNKVFMYNFGSSLFYVFAFMGFGTFMPKYIQYQYNTKGSTSSAVSGMIGTVSKAIGLLISGWAIQKWRFSARLLSGWNVVLGILTFTSMIVFSNVGCPSTNIPINLDGACNADCACPQDARINPICAKDGATAFYSPCMAGCQSYYYDKNTRTKMYSNCTCIEESWMQNNMSLTEEWIKKGPLKFMDYPSKSNILTAQEKSKVTPNDEAIGGFCPVDCKNVFVIFSTVMFLLMILGSTGRVGNVLVALRCIDVRDKSLSMAFNVVFLSLLAMLPSPMVYGAIMDTTCTLFQRECGETTNCMLYDLPLMRKTLMLTTAFIMSIGVIFDIAVWYHCKDVHIFDPKEEQEAQEVPEQKEQNGTSKQI